MDISRLLEEARTDPTLLSQIDVEKLLESIESVENDFLENHTLDSIANDVFESLKYHLFMNQRIGRALLEEYCAKLVGYRYVSELHVLHKGKYVRWIRLEQPTKMSVGGIVVDIKFGNDGANILCRLSSGRFIQYRFDRCLTYQKLTEQEQLILMVYQQNAI